MSPVFENTFYSCGLEIFLGEEYRQRQRCRRRRRRWLREVVRQLSAN